MPRRRKNKTIEWLKYNWGYIVIIVVMLILVSFGIGYVK